MSCFENIEYKENDFLLLNPLTIESNQITLSEDDCGLDSFVVGEDNEITKGEGNELQLTSPVVNPPLIDLNCEYFKISNLFSEIQTYEQKQKALKNLGLLGRIETIPHEIGKIAPTAGISVDDNSATIEKIKGESVVWNQLNNIVQVNNTVYANRTYFTTMQIKIKPGIYCIKCHVDTDVALKGASFLIWDGLSNTFTPGTIPTNNTFYYIVHVPVDGTGSLNVTYNTIDENKPFNAITYLYDLTQMFGAGNEPTTIKEFEARKPLGVTNEYNEGTIVSFQGGDIKSVGFNAWDEEVHFGYYVAENGMHSNKQNLLCSKNPIKIIPNSTYYKNVNEFGIFYDINMNYIGYHGKVNTFTTPPNAAYYQFNIPSEYGTTYNNDICLHLVHSGYRNGDYEPYVDDVHSLPDIKSIKDSNGDTLFPYGLLSAGSVHDEITTTKAIKRIGVVDMGSLNWGNVEIGEFVLKLANISTAVKRDRFAVLTNKYVTVDKKYTALLNGEITSYLVPTDTIVHSRIGIRDDFYTDAATFKQAMNGVLLYYELAEPIEVDLEEPLNMTYEAWDFGTEELVVSEPSTSLKGEIIYHFNAVDRIRENSRAIETLKEHVEERKDDGIELLTNGNLKLTLKGETREFMPATPSGDPMHYAYETAGAVYNATTDFIVKDAPWKDMVDTIEDKAKWGFDVVDASQVKQMTIGGTIYNYVQTTRQSPQGTTEPRYYLVGQASDGTWVEDETKVLHLPGHWYLNGLGDITNKEMMRIDYEKEIKYRWDKIRGAQGTRARTTIAVDTIENIDMIPTLQTPYGILAEAICITVHLPYTVTEKARAISVLYTGKGNKTKYVQTCKSATGTPFDEAHVISFIDLNVNCSLTNVITISKPSLIYTINNANPTTAITITLHTNRYAQLAEDADIIAALEAKNTDLEGTGGSISLVSA